MASIGAPGHNVITTFQGYIKKMIETPGMKALLLDKETTSMVSLVMAQSQIISQEVFLVERIEQDPAKENQPQPEVSMHHIKGVVFIRPTVKSVGALKALLKRPKYKEYHVFFSNIVKEEFLKSLAEADEFEVVKQVHEYYGDYYAVNPELWHLNLAHTKCLQQPDDYWYDGEKALFRRVCDGIVASLLSMKKRPAVRFTRSSDLTKKIAAEVSRRMNAEAELFHFGANSGSPLLLVLDRRDDPVTPLLLQWTYQAMVHELFTLHNNRVDLGSVPGIKKDMKEVVFSCDQDKFFRENMSANYGDLGASIRGLVETFGQKMKINKKVQSIADMQRFMDEYPEFRAQQSTVSKHMTVVGEIFRQVEMRDLLAVSEVEQELACQNDHAAALPKVLAMMENPKLSDDDRLRVALLYCIRYEGQKAQIAQVKALLRDKATTDAARKKVVAIDALLQYAGQNIRGGDAESTSKKIFDRVRGMFGTGLNGVENVYTQHKPTLSTTLDLLMKRQLKTSTFPYFEGPQEPRPHDDIFVFIAGGVTFEEAVVIQQLNASQQELRFILGGTLIHNSTSFLDDILTDGARDSDDFKRADVLA